MNKGRERYGTVYCATTGLTGRQPLRMGSGLACGEQSSTEWVCLSRQQSECPVSVELIHCVFCFSVSFLSALQQKEQQTNN